MMSIILSLPPELVKLIFMASVIFSAHRFIYGKGFNDES